MAQPKKKRSHSKQGHVRHHWKASLPSLVKCKSCGEMKFSHKVCGACGHYNGLYVGYGKQAG
jgi:large subunit ribosomal protein L32